MFRRAKRKFELDEKTTEMLNKLMELRKRQQKKDRIAPNIILRYLIEKEVQLIRDDYPTMEEINKRNIMRMFRLKDQKKNPIFYCPQIHMDITNLMVCHIRCQYGHMLECHWPYTCNSDYCHHYRHQEDFEQNPNMRGEIQNGN
ncbi:MAG: hypothetical protein ACFE8A_13395 [Candidatus Hodarchaeota archaeon]